ncbi:hypothetical protein ACLOJK_015200 [Asimina triloba]
MAILLQASNNTFIFSLKVVLLSTAVLSTALILNLSAPAMRDFFSSVLPQIWSSFLSWLTPPYLYLVINGIIISIAASSKFQHANPDDVVESVPSKIQTEIRPDFEDPAQYEAPALKASAVLRTDDFTAPAQYETAVVKSPEEVLPDFEAPDGSYGSADGRALESTEGGEEAEEEEEEEFVLSKSDWRRKRIDSTEYSLVTEKPLVSVRFGHKKSVKASPDGSKAALRVAKPKRHETLESTWKTITDGRPMPLTRHLKKSDTWETHGRPSRMMEDAASPAMTKKSETMRERDGKFSPSPGSSSGKLLRKESSLSQDELNRRVEAFIKKFNEEMRMQRQESIQQYMDMINRGSQ